MCEGLWPLDSLFLDPFFRGARRDPRCPDFSCQDTPWKRWVCQVLSSKPSFGFVLFGVFRAMALAEEVNMECPCLLMSTLRLQEMAM